VYTATDCTTAQQHAKSHVLPDFEGEEKTSRSLC